MPTHALYVAAGALVQYTHQEAPSVRGVLAVQTSGSSLHGVSLGYSGFISEEERELQILATTSTIFTSSTIEPE